ncbi:methylmalonyl Co-A mutase-associated GTPase MeaB [Rhodobacteraceae bacterium NNCM2]|nr:methylmalonyl Co-A mutase-associated GTPase MeaB [Coraliihabitans acroporae]
MTNLQELKSGGKVALARALTALEARAEDADVAALLDAALLAPRGIVLGLTGPPGVGKSTLIDALIGEIRSRGRTLGVIAVDPSSRRSRGALLGDRTRFRIDPEDDGVFVRSMAARERLGGVADITFPASVLMRALFDVVIVETVGVGQSEYSIADQADLVVLCAQPGSGDALQFMKAGVMEVPDLILVTKGDMESLARRTVTDLRGALSLVAGGVAATEILRCSAAKGEGLGEIVDWVDARIRQTGADAPARRRAQALRWAEDHLADRFGQEGLAALKNTTKWPPDGQPFTELTKSLCQIRGKFSEVFQEDSRK